MAVLAIIKQMHHLSDEPVRPLAGEPYYQYFCAEEFFRYKRSFDCFSINRWRQQMGQQRLVRCCKRVWPPPAHER
jgi:IS5 family transposase